MDAPAATLVQKLLARAAAREHVAVGEAIDCAVDLAVLNAALPGPVRDPARVLLALERAGPPAEAAAAARRRSALAWAEREGLGAVIDGLGPAALVAPQRGRMRPGLLCVGDDAQCGMLGAFGVLALTRTAATLVTAVARGSLDLRVPRTAFVRWTGRLCDGVSAHDMGLALRPYFATHSPQGMVIEHGGEALCALPMDERMSLAALSLSLGAEACVMAPDAMTRAWLDAVGADVDAAGLAHWISDEDAPGSRHHDDASGLVPLVALPGDPDHARTLDELEPTAVEMAWLGGCCGGKFHDLHAAARVLAGYRVAHGVQLLVSPASVADREAAERDGVLRRLVEAGATLLPPGADALALWRAVDGRRVVAAAPCPGGAQAVLASPYTVAASALNGRLSDARAVLA